MWSGKTFATAVITQIIWPDEVANQDRGRNQTHQISGESIKEFPSHKGPK